MTDVVFRRRTNIMTERSSKWGSITALATGALGRMMARYPAYLIALTLLLVLCRCAGGR
jgi:hypothetical protein